MSRSSTTTEPDYVPGDFSNFVAPACHPGEHLREDFLADYELTPTALAQAMGLPDASPLQALLDERSDMTADLALRLGKVFGTTAQLWMGLQAAHDLSKAAIAKRDELARIRPLSAEAA